MTSSKFSVSAVKTVKVSALYANEFFIKYGLDKLDPKYLDEAKYFGILEIPVVMVDKKGDTSVLSHWQDVKAAIEMGKDDIEVKEISLADGSEISQADILRFINFKNYCGQSGDYVTTYHMAKEIDKAYINDEAWVSDVQGDKKEVRANLMGYGTTHLQNIVAMGDKDIKILEDIRDGRVVYSQALKEFKDERVTKPKQGRSNPTSSNDVKDKTIFFDVELFRAKFGNTVFDITVLNGVPTVFKNNLQITDFNFYHENEMDKKVVGASRYIFQIEGIKKSIHIIANNPNDF